MLVLGRHLELAAPSVAAPVRLLCGAWHRIGWTGVDLFFVLSGFLVSGLLFTEFQRHGSVQIGRFLLRRGFKIYPPFYVLLLATALLWSRWPSLAAPLPADFVFVRGWLYEALYLQNYGPAIWGHTWSLAIEEHFYFLLAAVVGLSLRWSRGGSRNPFRVIVPLALAVAVAALGLRIATSLHSAYTHKTHLYPTHLRLDSLLWGVLLSYAYHFEREKLLRFAARWRRLMVLGALIFVAPALVWSLPSSPFLATVGLTTIALGFAAALLVLIHTGARQPSGAAASRLSAALAQIGVYSYSIYLWHLPVQWWLPELMRRHGVLAQASPTIAYLAVSVLYLGASIAGGIAMARIVERPSLRLRDRLLPSRAGALATGSTA